MLAIVLTCVFAACVFAACGSDAPARRPDAAPAAPGRPWRSPRPSRRRRPPTVAIKGLTGTLNQDDVHQTMDAQQPAFDACIGESRRSLRWVSGAIRFAFKVGAEGQVEDVHPIESTIGHRRSRRAWRRRGRDRVSQAGRPRDARRSPGA